MSDFAYFILLHKINFVTVSFTIQSFLLIGYLPTYTD